MRKVVLELMTKFIGLITKQGREAKILQWKRRIHFTLEQQGGTGIDSPLQNTHSQKSTFDSPKTTTYTLLLTGSLSDNINNRYFVYVLHTIVLQ